MEQYYEQLSLVDLILCKNIRSSTKMIKPQDVDFSSPEATLLSTEAQRFQGYDLEAEGAVREVIEEHEDYDLVQVTLPLGEGTIKRLVKAFKNGEVVEQPEEEPEVEVEVPVVTLKSITAQGPTTAVVGEEVQFSFTTNPANYEAKSVKWETTNGIIGDDGVLLAETAGAYTVKATVDGKTSSKSGTATLPVIALTDFSFGEVQSVVLGGSIQLTRTLTPADAVINSEVWSTQAGQITQEGLFTPAGVGQAPVTLTINGVAKTLEIEVVEAPVSEDPAQ